MALDADGDLYLAGYEGGITGITTLQPTGDAKGFVARLDRSGEQRWRQSFDTPDTDTAEGIAVDPASGAVNLVGRTKGVVAGEVNQGQFDLFVATLGPSGDVQRLFQAGRERPEHPARIALGASGRLLVAGYDDIFIPFKSVQAEEDGFVLALDVDPGADHGISERWWRRADSATPDRITGAALDPATGSAFVAGFDLVDGAFLEKLDANGERVFRLMSQQVGGAVDVVALSPDGDLYVAGAVIVGAGQDGPASPAVFVSKRAADTGDELWSTLVRGTHLVWPTNLAFGASGHVYVAGHTVGSLEGKAPNAGKEDMFTLRINSKGKLVGSWQRGTEGDDVPSSIAVDACGNVFIAGYTEGALVDGQGSAGGRDGFVLRLEL